MGPTQLEYARLTMALSLAFHIIFASIGMVMPFFMAVAHYLYLKTKKLELNLKAMKIALAFGALAALMQPFSGHYSAQKVAENQPIKLAAMEAHFHTTTKAPLYI